MIGLTLQGRLANHWFEYAFLRTVAEHHGYAYTIVESKEPNMELDYHQWYSEDIFSMSVPVIPKRPFLYNYYDVNGSYLTTTVLRQNYAEFKDETLFRGPFQGRDVIERIRTDWFPVIQPKTPFEYDVDDCCVIHFRGADYVNRMVWRPICGLLKDIGLYYEEAKQRLDALAGKQLKTIVVTDDIPNARLYVNADEYVCQSVATDFFLMYQAKYLVIPNSTFSWWAGFLSPNLCICVAPSGWLYYKHGEKIHTDWCYTDKFMWI